MCAVENGVENLCLSKMGRGMCVCQECGGECVFGENRHSLEQNEAQSTCAESTSKGVHLHSKGRELAVRMSHTLTTVLSPLPK